VFGLFAHLGGDGLDVAIDEEGSTHAGSEVGGGIEVAGFLDFVASGDDIAWGHPATIVDDAADTTIGHGFVSVLIDDHHFG